MFKAVESSRVCAVVLASTLGCAIGVEEGTTWGVPGNGDDGQGSAGDASAGDSDSGDPGGVETGDPPDGGDDSDGGAGDETSGGGDGADDPAADDGGTTSGGAADDGGTDDGGTTDDGGVVDEGTGSTGGQGGAAAWEFCVDGMECADGMGCLRNGEPATDGFCTTECVGFLDTSGCIPPPPGGDSVLTCLILGGTNICALDCAGGKTCPTGMGCITDADDNGAIEICM